MTDTALHSTTIHVYNVVSNCYLKYVHLSNAMDKNKAYRNVSI